MALTGRLRRLTRTTRNRDRMAVVDVLQRAFSGSLEIMSGLGAALVHADPEPADGTDHHAALAPHRRVRPAAS